MNRLFALLAVTALMIGCGSSTEEPETDQSEEDVKSSDGSEETEIDPVTGKPVERSPSYEGASCATCGPVPDPWKPLPPGGRNGNNNSDKR